MNLEAKFYELADQLHEALRRLAVVEREQSYLPVRLPSAVHRRLIESTASALILPGESGAVAGTSPNPLNATGYPVWAGATVWLDASQKFIISSDADMLIAGDWDGSGSKTLVASYGFGAGIDDTNFLINDPLGLLDDITSTDNGVLFATGGESSGSHLLTVVSTEAGGSGGSGGGFEWPGPGEGPNEGTATVSIIRANVNVAPAGTSNAASIPFDGGVAIIGTAVASGSFFNLDGKAFADNENVLLISDNAGAWAALKVGVNIGRAKVNVAGGVAAATATFAIDNMLAVEGHAPPTATATANNANAQAWADNEDIWWIHQDDDNFLPLKSDSVNIVLASVNDATHVEAAAGTYSFNGATALYGAAPSGGTGTANNTRGENYLDHQQVVLIQRKDNGEWETLTPGDAGSIILGQASAAVDADDPSFTLNSITVALGAGTAESSVTVLNTFGFDISSGASVAAVGSDATSWVAIQAECPDS